MAISLIDQLISALRLLPGVGPKTAQRMALHILQHNKNGGMQLSKILQEAIEKVGHCTRCRTLSETALCPVCANNNRDQGLLCVVENPIDISALEQTSSYRGYYFVLHGRLSPLDGFGPNEIGVKELLTTLEKNPTIREVIIATNPTIEGEATAHYLSQLIKAKNIECSRIAYGVPMGGELEYLDGNTLSRAFQGRSKIK
jgi:recombination protein RecR